MVRSFSFSYSKPSDLTLVGLLYFFRTVCSCFSSLHLICLFLVQYKVQERKSLHFTEEGILFYSYANKYKFVSWAQQWPPSLISAFTLILSTNSFWNICPSNWFVPIGAPCIPPSLSWCPCDPPIRPDLEDIRALIRYWKCVTASCASFLQTQPKSPPPLTSTKSFCIIICITCLSDSKVKLRMRERDTV